MNKLHGETEAAYKIAQNHCDGNGILQDYSTLESLRELLIQESHGRLAQLDRLVQYGDEYGIDRYVIGTVAEWKRVGLVSMDKDSRKMIFK